MSQSLDSLRSAWRSLLATRTTALAAVATLALGTGANTAVLAVAYGVLIRPLPYAAPGRLMVIDTVSAATRNRVGIPLAEVDEWTRRLATVETLAAFTPADLTLRGAGDAENLHCLLVTGDFFKVLGIAPDRGQAFTSSRAESLVLSARAADEWAGGTSTLGRTVTLGPTTFQVGAVMPARFTFPTDDVDAWVPAAPVGALQVFGNSDQRRYRLIARLRSGATLAAVRGEAAEAVRAMHPETPVLLSTVEPLVDQLTGDTRPVVSAFVIAAALLLLVACANTAVLLVGRAAARRRELAVRLALGATPGRLVGVALLESAVLAVSGSVLGLAVARVALRLLLQAAGGSLPRQSAIVIDWPVLLVVALVASLVTVLSGLAPALGAARTDFAGAFRATGLPAATSRTRGPLVVLQVAIAVLLLTGAGLLGRTVMGLLRGHGGVNPDHVVTARLMLGQGTTFDASGRRPFVDELLGRVRALPGVVAAGVGGGLPPNANMLSMTIRMVDAAGHGPAYSVDLVPVTPGYIQALGIRLDAGRLFDERDASRDAPIALLSAATARDLSARQNPVGRDFVAALPTATGAHVRPQVVGIVSDVHYTGLDAVANDNVYVLWSNLPTALSFLVVRTAGDPATLMAAIRGLVHDLDPGLPLPALRTLEDQMHLAIAGRELRVELVGAFSLLALLVAVLGLSATLARSVVERQSELAIRSALGSTPQGVVTLVAISGLRLVGLGVAAGLLLAAALGRYLAAQLTGVSPYDPATYLGVGLVVLLTAALACYLPARRASGIDPIALLRGE